MASPLEVANCIKLRANLTLRIFFNPKISQYIADTSRQSVYSYKYVIYSSYRLIYTAARNTVYMIPLGNGIST